MLSVSRCGLKVVLQIIQIMGTNMTDSTNMHNKCNSNFINNTITIFFSIGLGQLKRQP